MRIKYKFFLLIFFTLLTISLIIGYILRTEEKNEILKYTERQLQTIAQVRGQQISIAFSKSIKIIKFISSDKIFVDLFNQNKTEKQVLKLVNLRILKILKLYRSISVIRVLNNKGISIAASDGKTGINKSKSKMFLEGKKDLYFSEIKKGKVTGNIGISIAIPIIIESKIMGVITLNLDAEKELFPIVLDRTGLGAYGEVYIVNKNLYMVTPSRYIRNSVFTKQINLEQFKKNGMESTFRDQPENKINFAGTYKNYNNKKVIGYHYYLKELKCILIAEIEMDEVFLPLAKFTSKIFKVFLVILLVVFFITLILSHMVITPVSVIFNGIKEYKNGNLGYRLSTKRTDEFGVLINYFNDMANSIRKHEKELELHNEDLEYKVQKKTKELRKRTKNAEKQHAMLLAQENKIHSIFRSAPIGIGLVIDRKLAQVNEYFCNMVGYTVKELINKNSIIIYPSKEEYENVGKFKYERIKKYGIGTIETRLKRKDGKIIDVLMSSTPIDPDNYKIGVTFSALDITESKLAEVEKQKLEDQLRHAQKMEALGTLAGGIAHDFNNILGVIMGYTELTISAIDGNEATLSGLNKVMSASERAKDMVQQILMFSRKHETSVEPIKLEIVLREVVKFLRVSIPSTIEILLDIEDSLIKVNANETQINQVLMNLCTNASYAMKENGGQLNISLKNMEITSETVITDLSPGKYQLLEIRDTGPGIEKDIIEKIFEPYFTTKEVGEGTGLGLATVYGIVKNHEGYIKVYSEVGVGTLFKIYLPALDKDKTEKINKIGEIIPVGKGEMILFVDDETELAELGHKLLETLGYNVESWDDSREAFKSFKANPKRYDLLITDKTMPGLTGIKLVEKIHKIRADLPVIITTGFRDGLKKSDFKSLGLSDLIMKPIRKRDIAELVKKVMEK